MRLWVFSYSEEQVDKLKVDKQMLREIIKELSNWRAHATVLLSLYVPPGRPISDVLSLLRQEISVAENIKLKKTRTAVTWALSVAYDRVSKIPKIPENGLALFAGMDPDTGETITLMLVPPEKVTVFFYRTDKSFHTEFLEEMVSESNVVGLLIIERDEATIGLLKGNRLEVVDELGGYIPGKHHKGGQSQRRFDRIIEQMVEEFYKKVGEHTNNVFLPLLEQGKLKKIIIGGPGYAKQDFVQGNYLDYRLKQVTASELIDVSYQGEVGLRELIMKAGDLLEESEYAESLKYLEEFKYHLAKDDGLVVYGEEEVKLAADQGLLKVLLVSESRGDIESWLRDASSRGLKVVVLSKDMPEADWFNKTFEGIGGILKFKVEL
ncbi:MAG: peptide chain release factor aRF-1 [Desulfurococcaceae archaeon]